MARLQRAGAAAGGVLLLVAGAAFGQGAPGPVSLDAPAPVSAPPGSGPAMAAPAPPLPIVVVPSVDAALDAEPAVAVPRAMPAPAGPAASPATAEGSAPPSRSLRPEWPAGPDTGAGNPANMAGGLPKVEVPTPATPFTLTHPQAVDSATLAADGRRIALDGITALPDPSSGLQRYLRAQGDQVTCDPQGAGYACALPDGTDVALVSLANGAARATADAPEAYRQQEAAAQAARRGAWASLPPPPVTVEHPAVRTSALLASGTQTFPLYGLQGLPGRPAQDLQGYIVAHGDSVTCQQQPDGRTFLCTLPDGTDLGKAALVNGAARLAPGAPDSYRAQQADAAASRRGIWAAEAVPLPVVVAPPLPAYALAPPDGGVAYLGDQPTAVIDGEQEFFVFGGAGLGWGFWDRARHWHGAPDRYARELDRYHGNRFGEGRSPYIERPGFGRPGFERPGFEHGGFERGGIGRAGFVPGAGVRGGFVRPEPGFARPDFGRPGFGRPAGGPQGFAPHGFAPQGSARSLPAVGRPGPAPVVGRPAAPAAAARPAVPSGGGHHR